jgi:hypothetical protein
MSVPEPRGTRQEVAQVEKDEPELPRWSQTSLPNVLQPSRKTLDL